MSPNMVLFAVVFVIATVFFAWSCFQRFRLVALGKDDNRFDSVGRRIWNMLVRAFAQRCTVSHGYRFGFNHSVLFWCFMLLLIANTEFLFNGLFPDYIDIALLPTGLYYALALIFDLVSLLALLAVCVAVVRRLAFPPAYIVARSPDAFFILSLIAILMIAFFGLHGSEIARGNEEAARLMPISGLAAVIFSGASARVLVALTGFFWWVHAVTLLAFLNYLPYSKHMHILTSIPNCFFMSLEKVTTQPREEFKEGNTFGAGRVDQFSWKDLFDTYSCTECGRCTDSCPANFTGKPLNPRLVIHDMKVNLLKNGPQIGKNKGDTLLPLINEGQELEGSVSENVLWECTTCGACMEVCPVSIEHVPKIVDMRRNLVEMKARFPEELLAFFESMEQRSNPWGMAPGERVKWAADIDVKPFEAGKTDYLFYVGCAGAFDARNRRTTLAIARILDAAGISWGILGKDEACCGDSLRRLGNEFVFDRIAGENVRMFEEKGIKKIITQCPHCYSTLKNDYRQYGAELEVIHHADLINNLLKEGRLKLKKTNGLGKVVFHDSCYLGRYNLIYDAPRQVVASVTGHAPAEMGRHHDKSFCCGAGGGRMWMEEPIGKHINVARVEEAMEEDPGAVCVCCPYCMTMFEDGLKDKDALDKIQVLDLAEIVASALE